MQPFLTQRKNGVWYIVETHSDGKRSWISTRETDRRRAEDVLRKHRLGPALQPQGILLSAFTTEFLEYAAGAFARKTVLLYRDALTSFATQFGDPALPSCTPRHVDQFKVRRALSVKPITVNKELATLKAAFNLAMRWGYIESNPFSNARRLHVAGMPPVFFTREEVSLFLAGTRGTWMHDIALVGINTGLRAGELLNLQWQHIDLEKRIIRVHNAVNFQTKTGRARVVPLNEAAASVLTRSVYFNKHQNGHFA